jgi:hypothetical protein
MGHVILPSGSSKLVDEISGSINLSNLINDMKCEDYTNSYRFSMIAALGKLGHHAETAIPYLKEIVSKCTTQNDKLLSEAAEQALKKIEDKNSNTTYKPQSYPSYGPYGYHNSLLNTPKKPEVNKVVFTEIEVNELHDGLKHYCKCNFCQKMTSVNKHNRRFSDRLAGVDSFYCNYCIRNDFYHKFNANIMILTYRGIIGYYYYAYYVIPKNSTIFMADLQDYIELHVRAGLQNPIFKYDPETFCWFIDFSKIGKRKMPVESVLHTIIEQLACFNLYENVRECSPAKLYKKYYAAVMQFYQHRARVDDEMVFAPTLWNCDIPTRCSVGMRSLPVDILQNFFPTNMVDNNRHNVSHRRI